LALSENGSLFLVTGELMKFGPNGTIEWHSNFFASDYQARATRILDADNDCGILCSQDTTLSMINGDGVRTWEFTLDSPAQAGFIGHEGRILVVTNESRSTDPP